MLIICPCAADVIFLIYVYQRWIYPVDKTRVNEFGFGGEDEKVSDVTETAVTATNEEEKKTNWREDATYSAKLWRKRNRFSVSYIFSTFGVKWLGYKLSRKFLF